MYVDLEDEANENFEPVTGFLHSKNEQRSVYYEYDKSRAQTGIVDMLT